MDKAADKFQNTYRIPSARLQHWNYGWEGAYFVTVCTQNREQHFFGEVINGEMQVSELGKIVAADWLKTPQLRPDMNLELGAFVVMPNHFHGIIIIGPNQYNDLEPGKDAIMCRYAMHRVSTGTTGHSGNDDCQNTFGPQSKNLASVIRGFKSAVTMKARRINPNFAWQARFHDHIIRNEQSFQRITDYIENNPANWATDKFYLDR